MTRKDGFFDLEKDKEAVKEFMHEVSEKMIKFDSIEEKVVYLVKNDFYYDVFQYYTLDQVLKVFSTVYSYNFEFQSYMAVSKFYKDYALKTDDKSSYLEFYEDRIAIVALYLGMDVNDDGDIVAGNFNRAKNLAVAMIEQRYQPATPTFLNGGKSRRGEMVSCFLLEVGDSLNSIDFNIGTSMQLSKIGGGVALNLSKLRCMKDPIKGVKNAAKGVLPVMKLLEDSFNYADQMGQRKGAGAVYLNIFHFDTPEFLDTKKINADEKSRIQSLSIGLIIPDVFFKIAKKNEDFYMFSPYDVQKQFGEQLDEIELDKHYYDLVKLANEGKIRYRTMNARDMLTKIAQTQMESGYPYIMFKTNANKYHALKDIGSVKMSNLCTEIFQLQEESVINDYGIGDEINRDINCNLGSVNIVNVMETKKFQDTIHVGIEALTTVSDITKIPNAPTVRKANEELHAIGLGAMNLHGYLTKNKISYESKEARDFVRTFFMMMNYYSLEKSMLIAKERNRKFKDFEKSDYATGVYFKKYTETDYSPKTDKVKELFEGIYIPTTQDWINLANDIMKYGLYNAYRLAIAPTQSISYIQNSTSSVMPVVETVEIRTYANSTTYYPMPYLARDNQWYYKSAFNMNQFKLIDLIAEIQEHVDQGISTILFVDSNTSTRELARYYVYANEKGLKSLYYTRTKALSVEECTSCAV
jgi:ribonucleoside-diphosphate reductase alpha chain